MVQVSLPWNNFSTVCTPRSTPVSSTAPKHFSTEQINKLESRFSHQKWPDKTGVIIIAMESNLLRKDVEVCSYVKIEKSFKSQDMFFDMYTVCLAQFYISPCKLTNILTCLTLEWQNSDEFSKGIQYWLLFMKTVLS